MRAPLCSQPVLRLSSALPFLVDMPGQGGKSYAPIWLPPDSILFCPLPTPSPSLFSLPHELKAPCAIRRQFSLLGHFRIIEDKPCITPSLIKSNHTTNTTKGRARDPLLHVVIVSSVFWRNVSGRNHGALPRERDLHQGREENSQGKKVYQYIGFLSLCL